MIEIPMRHAVVYCTNGGDLERLRVSLYSVRKFIPDVDVYVLSDVVTQNELPDVKIIDPTGILSELGFFPDRWGRKWPYATLYRLAIPLIEELASLGKVLYLDTDTLVKSPRAVELFSMNVDGYEVFGTQDTTGTWARIDACIRNDLCQEAMRDILNKVWNDRKIQDQTYINAGVTVWNIQQIVKNGIDWYKQKLKWFWEAELRGKFKYLDQDFINSMLRVLPTMPREFDAFGEEIFIHSYKEIVIQHYTAGSKNNMFKDVLDIGYAYEGPCKIVVYSSDGGDKARLLASAASVKKHLGPFVKFYILTELDKYPGFEEATLINPVKTLTDLGFFKDNWSRRWPFSTLFRLAIPLLEEFKDVDKVLYLDTDTLVRSSDANRLFKMEARGFEVYGVQDCEARQWNIERIIANDFPPEARQAMKKMWMEDAKDTQGYINAGVILEFLSEIRKNGLDNYAQKLKWFWGCVITGKLTFLDQDFINVMMHVSPSLSVRFNKFGGDSNTNCIIQHFVAGTKANMSAVARHMGIHM